MLRLIVLFSTFLSLASSQHRGDFSIPQNCFDRDCTFKINWASMPDGMLEFTVHAKVPKGIWAGIGFSLRGEMVTSDAVVGWMPDNDDEDFVLTDRFLFGKSPGQVPVDNDENDIVLTSFSHDDNMLKYSFTRPISPKDFAADLPLEDGIFIIYAWGGEGISRERITAHTNQGSIGWKVNFVNLPAIPSFPTPPPTLNGTGFPSFQFPSEDEMDEYNRAETDTATPDDPDTPVSADGGSMNVNGATDMPEPAIPDTPTPDDGDLPASIDDGSMNETDVTDTPEPDIPDIPEPGMTDAPLPDVSNINGNDTRMQTMAKEIPSPSGGRSLENQIEDSDSCVGKACPRNSQCTMERGVARCYCIPGYPMDQYGNCGGPSEMTPAMPTVAPPPPGMPGVSPTMPMFSLPPTTVQETAAAGDKCFRIRCPANAVCRDGRCFCKPGHKGHSDGTCKSIAPIDRCAGVRCSINMICQDGACVCRPGYDFQSDGTCKAIVVDKCARVRCPANAKCRDGSCFCVRGYSSHIDGSCRDKCKGMHCPQHSTCRDGACYCASGYSKHNDGSCHVTSSLGPYCGGRRCPVNAECRIGRCYCKTGYVRHESSCVKWSVLSGCSTMNCGTGTCVIRDGQAGCSFSSTRPHPSSHSSGSCYGRCGQHSTHMCSCSSHCLRYGGCCRDYNHYCHSSGTCRGRCGSYLTTHNCSCSHRCRRYGVCCPDFYNYCGQRYPHYYPHHG